MKLSRLCAWQIYAIGASACALVIAGACWAFIIPALQRSQRHAELHREMRQRQKQVALLRVELGTTRCQTAEIRKSLADTGIRLHSAAAINQSIAKLARLATEAGLTIDEIRGGTPAERRSLQVVPIRIAGSGSFPNCTAFLHQLHEQFPDMLLRGIEQSTVPAGAKAALPSFRIELTWCVAK